MVAEDECSVDEPIPKAKLSRKDTDFPRHHLPQRMKNNAPHIHWKSLVQQKKVILPRKRSLGIATGANDDNAFPSFDADCLEDDEGNAMESDKHYDNAEEPDSSVLAGVVWAPKCGMFKPSGACKIFTRGKGSYFIVADC